MNDELFVAALAFVGDGLPVFPCKPRGKLPMVKGGFKAATVDTEQVRKWWSKWRQANIGIPTGAVSGFVVLDVDPGGDDSLATLTGSHGPLPETRAVKTGRGRQLWFKYPSVPVRCSAGVLGLGLDFRGDGGYVIAPPSIHQNGQRYAFLNNCELAEMSDWLINVIQQGKSAPNPTPHSDGSGGKIREGARNATLASIAGTMRKRGLGETAIRAVWGIAEDADDAEKRIMVRVKGNLSHDPGGLAYRIDVTSGIPVIAWEPGVVDMRADDVLGGLDSREDRCERREAEAWLKDFLARGPKPASEVERQSKRAGFAPATVRRASDALRVKKQKSGFDSGWEWRLPERAQSEDAQPEIVSTFEEGEL